MKKLLLGVLVALLGFTVALGHGEDYGMFVEVIDADGSFEDVTAAVEAALADSDFELLGGWDVAVPEAGASYRSKVFVLHDPAYTEMVGGFAGPHAPAAILRVNVFEFGSAKKVRVNIADPETTARVYLYQHGIGEDDFHAMLALADEARLALQDLIEQAVPGNVLNQPSGPIRREGELLPYVGDGDAQVMVNFSDYAANYDNGFIQSFATRDEAVGYAKDRIAGNGEGWELVAELAVGEGYYLGVSKGPVESVSAEIVGGALGASSANPVPGINHNAAYPIDVLVYKDGDAFKLAYPGQMWRMMLYYWDAGIGAFVQYQTLPGEFDASLLTMLGG